MRGRVQMKIDQGLRRPLIVARQAPAGNYNSIWCAGLFEVGRQTLLMRLFRSKFGT